MGASSKAGSDQRNRETFFFENESLWEQKKCETTSPSFEPGGDTFSPHKPPFSRIALVTLLGKAPRISGTTASEV